MVFIAAPWPENFENDAERKQTFEDAVAKFNRLIATFALSDYAIHTLPKASVPEQIDFVSRYMDQFQQTSENFMDLQRTVPWGRDFSEYLEMFSLSSLRAGDTVIGCGDGPASFNAEATSRGICVISVDPLYVLSKADLELRIDVAREQVMPQVRAKIDDYIWRSIESPDELERRRMQAMQAFLLDYDEGCRTGRYIAASLPTLPFQDNAFDYGLCSHLLFLYSPQLDEQQHIDSVLELCRVAREVRIYPLVSIDDNKPSRHLPAVLLALAEIECTFEEVPVTYEFQRGASTMLKIRT